MIRMNKKIFFTSILVIFLMVVPVFGDEEVKTVKYYGGYVSDADAGTPYSKEISFISPDGVSKIFYAKVIVTADMTTTDTRFYIKVADEFCNPEYYDIEDDVDRYGMEFDCTEIATKQGIYEAGFQATEDVKNVFVEMEFTYRNNPSNVPEKSLTIQGTDYFINEYGTVFLQLRDDEGEAVNNGLCVLDVYYPIGVNVSHPIWIEDAPMFYLENSSGIYYYDINVPNVTGIYILDAECSYTLDNVKYYEGIAEYPERYVIHGTYTGSTATLNSFQDYIYTKCVSSGGAMKVCEAHYDYIVGESNISSLSLLYMGESNGILTGTFSVYNWTSDSWVSLPNDVVYSGNAIQFPSGVNDVATNSIPDLSNTIASNGTVRIRLYASLGFVFDVYHNYLQLLSSEEGTVVTDVRGAGEIHVSESVIGSVGNVSSVANAYSTFSNMKYAGGTEYKSGEEGFAVYQFIRVKSGNAIPINDADWCNITIFYPNNSLFVSNVSMSYVIGSNGMYSYNFTTPYIEGVYKTDAHCYYDVEKLDGYGSSTFHVSPASNKVFDLEQFIASNFTNTNGLIISVNETVLVVNNTVMTKLYGVQDEIADLDENIQNNFTYTNALISSINNSIVSLINGVSTQITNLNNYLNTTLARIEWKIDNLNTTLTNLTVGNVTLTVNVDEDAIAIETLRKFCYYGAIDIYGQEICRGVNERGTLT